MEEEEDAKSIDDVLTALLSMGFELEDSQAAVQSGRLTVESAVEWLLTQKHRPANTCRLYEVDPLVSSDPCPPTSSEETSCQTTSSSSCDKPDDNDEENVISRRFVNTKQKEIKEKFEEKQRNEAQRLAILEKKQQKSARALVLQQIANDREQQKQKHISCSVGTSSTTPPEPSPSPSTSSPPPIEASTEDENQPRTTPVACNMQIRHPDGQSLRHTFDGSTLLQDVWNYATENFTDTENMCLMQPFPRRDFTLEDASKSLFELGLCPSVGLVLKKTDGSQQAFVSEGYNYQQAFQRSYVPRFLGLSDDDDDEEEEDDDEEDDVSPHHRHRSSLLHPWGQGHRLDDEQDADEHAPEEPEDEEEENHEEELYELQEDGLLHPVGGFPEPHHIGVFGGVGMRLLPEGDPRADNVPEPSATNLRRLAVAAATDRHSRKFRSRSPSRPQHYHHHHHHRHHHQHPPHPHHSHMVSSLEYLCLHYMANRLSNPREPPLPLHGLSQQPAQRLLDFLRKEKLLKPKTLQAFLPCRLQKLTLDSYAYVTNELLYAIRMHTNLIHLSLNSCRLVTDHGLQPLTALKKLKTLKLGFCRQLTDNCLTPISSLHSLATLVLENTGVTDAGIIQYITNLSMHQPPNLKCLNLNRTAVTQKIFGHLTELPKLKVLLLEQSMVTRLPGVEEITQLITLDISHTKVDTDSIRSLSNHPNLRYLSLAHTDNIMGDQALSYLKCLKLREIKLPNRHRTTDEGILHLADIPLSTLDLTNYINVGNTGMAGVGKIHSLKVLLLGNTKVTDDGLNALKDLNQLEILYLDRTKITNKCAPVFKFFTKLVELSLASTLISSSFLTSGHLNNCTQLERLNLSRTRIDDRGLVCLHLRLLSLLNLDGTRVRPTAVSELTGCPHLQRVTLNNLVTVNADEEDTAAVSEEEQNPLQI